MPSRSRCGLRVGDRRHCSVTIIVLRSTGSACQATGVVMGSTPSCNGPSHPATHPPPPLHEGGNGWSAARAVQAALTAALAMRQHDAAGTEAHRIPGTSIAWAERLGRSPLAVGVDGAAFQVQRALEDLQLRPPQQSAPRLCTRSTVRQVARESVWLLPRADVDT